MSVSQHETVSHELRQAEVRGAPVPQDDKLKSVQATTYGSFWVDGSEIALPVATIREIVNEPDEITFVPLSPPFLKGLFNIRGMTIPIVDLHLLFELPHSNSSEPAVDKRKVAILENGDKCVGVLFDKAGEVLQKPVWAGVNLQKTSAQTKAGVIDGVLSLEHGNRRVLTIDPDALLGLDRLPHAKTVDSRPTKGRRLDRRLSCVSFELGQSKCAIDLRYVHEVRDMPPIDSSWLVGGDAIGTFILRGARTPVVDFQSYMSKDAASPTDDDVLSQRKLILIKTNSGLVGLMVNAIDSIIPFFEHDVSPFAELALPRGDVVKGSLFGKKEEVVILLDHNALISDPDLVEPAKVCRDMQDSVEIEEVETSATGARKTFIIFSLDGCFAIDTSYVIEVIDKPAPLLQPSFRLNYVEGIINLRGELITLFNLRKIYGMGTCDIDEQKILIFRVAERKYAVLVDSVDDIAEATSDKIVPNFEIEGSAIASPTYGEVSNMLDFGRAGDRRQYAMILDAPALVLRFGRK